MNSINFSWVDIFFTRSIKVFLSPYEKRKFIKSIIIYLKADIANVDTKIIIIQALEAIKINEHFMIKELNISIDDYINQIDFIFRDWFKKFEKLDSKQIRVL